jgi:aromatic ring-opening dioxygenase catalytic subunit (LigB family)
MPLPYPTLFVNHGGGPMPLMGQFPSLVKHLKSIPSLLSQNTHTHPSAIVVISAHWENKGPIAITSHPQPPMLFDYFGFPDEAYKYSYPAPGSPKLASKIQQLLQNNDIEAILDPDRGFDHGVFIPLMIMFPQAKIPVVTISLQSSLDPDFHLKLGEALTPLRLMHWTGEDDDEQSSCESQNGSILILGSGFTFHNMRAFFNPTDSFIQSSISFNTWLKSTLTSSWTEKRKALMNWKSAPGALTCHPREEHLLPLFVVTGAAGPNSRAKIIYDTSDQGMDEKDGYYDVSGYIFL